LRIHFIALFVLLALASTAQANTYSVSNTADSGAGSLRQAILDSNSPAAGTHTINFSGTFPDNGVIAISSDLPLIQSTSLSIVGGSKLPRIDGQSLHALIRISTTTTTLQLSDLVLKDGHAASGGCVSSGNSTSNGLLAVERVSFEGCDASGTNLVFGGAINWARSSGSVSLVDSQFLNNGAMATASNAEAGGGAIYTSSNLTALRTLFEGNVALSSTGGGYGGAIALSGNVRSSSITESTFRFNGASPASALFGYGGAVYFSCNNCSVQIVRSYLRGNSANYGGAVYARKTSAGAADAFVTLANSTFFNSSVVNQGGAIYIGGGASLSASNNTIYNGDASSGAHLSFGNGAEVNYFRANLLATTVFGSACSGSPVVTNPGFVGFNLLSDSSCTALEAGALPNSPLGSAFVDERAGAIGVIRFSGSAVIDSITASSICEPRDARFQVRPIDGNGDGDAFCDVGAYEDPFDIIFLDGFDS
jgi:hypothetical protein